MASRLIPNSDAWGGSWGAASAWGGSWGWSWSPLHEVEEQPNLVPAGHWKHLFRPIKAAVSPEVKGVVRAKWSIRFPVAVVKIVIPAETQFVSGRVRCRVGEVQLPVSGAIAPSVRGVVKTRTGFVRVPTIPATTRFTRGAAYSRCAVSLPTCGVTAPTARGRAYATSWVMPPKCVKNPTVEEMLAWL